MLEQTTWALWNPNVVSFTILGRSSRDVWSKMHATLHEGEFNSPAAKKQRRIWREMGFKCVKVKITEIPPKNGK